MQNWHLLHTKPGSERLAQQQLSKVVDGTLLPLAKMPVRQRDRTVERIGPLFPCYLFAFFSLAHASRKIRYTPGVCDVVRFGERAPVVPDWVIGQLALKCADGPIELSVPRLSRGETVKIASGPFRQFGAVFDGYLSGSERVAVLLSVMNAERRVVMPGQMVLAA